MAPNLTPAVCEAPSLRVARITLKTSAFKTLAPTDRAAVLWRALDLCIVSAEQRAHICFGSEDIPAALVKIDITFPWSPFTNTSILGHLATDYPALVRSLRVLKLNNYPCDESAALGAFAALATRLTELTFQCCDLTVRGLDGRCEVLTKVDLRCCVRLTSLDGLEHHMYLEELDASGTAITSVEPLRTCPALWKVDLGDCQRLSSIEGLEEHQWLREVDAYDTAIRCIEPLRTCPALTKVTMNGCVQISSIEALEGHEWLEEVDVRETAITSVEPLRTCPALKRLVLRYCQQLPADVNLPVGVEIIR